MRFDKMRPQEHFGRQSAAAAPQRGESSFSFDQETLNETVVKAALLESFRPWAPSSRAPHLRGFFSDGLKGLDESRRQRFDKMRPQEHFGRQSAAVAPQGGESSAGSAARIIPPLCTINPMHHYATSARSLRTQPPAYSKRATDFSIRLDIVDEMDQTGTHSCPRQKSSPTSVFQRAK